MYTSTYKYIYNLNGNAKINSLENRAKHVCIQEMISLINDTCFQIEPFPIDQIITKNDKQNIIQTTIISCRKLK